MRNQCEGEGGREGGTVSREAYGTRELSLANL